MYRRLLTHNGRPLQKLFWVHILMKSFPHIQVLFLEYIKKRNREEEPRTYFWLRINFDLSSELLDDHFWDGKAESHPTLIDVLAAWNLSEELK